MGRNEKVVEQERREKREERREKREERRETLHCTAVHCTATSCVSARLFLVQLGRVRRRIAVVLNTFLSFREETAWW